MKNASFVFYASFHEALEELSDVKYGKLMRAINNYAINGVMPELKKELKMAFLLIKPQIDANIERRENGKAGGRPKKGAQAEHCQTDCSVIEENDDKTASEQDIPENTQEIEKTTGYSDDETEKTIGGQNQKPNVNVNVNANANANDIPPEQSGGKDKRPILQPKPDSTPDEPAPIQKTQTIPEQAERLARLLYDLHRQIDTHFTTSQKHIEQWAKDIEKLNRIDKRSYQDIEKVIHWIKTEGNFWAPNIISGSKLREKYPQIFLQMQQPKRSPPRGNAPNYQQQNFNADSLPELFKQSRLEKPPDETAALDGVVF